MSIPLSTLLLAAGNATRFGSAKQCLSLDGVSLVRRAAQAGLAVAAETVVVTGAYADEVAQELAGMPLTLLHNPNWEAGMGASIACGIGYMAELARPPEATIICLADQPLVGANQLQRLIGAHRSNPERIAASDHGRALGPPCIFPHRYYTELKKLTGAEGAKRLLAQYMHQLILVAMPEASVDIDTPEDYEHLVTG